jgi:WD domain, G-beta repeat.
MGNICTVCKKLAEVSCYCNNEIRSCYNHEIIHNEELLQEKKLQSFKFSKNLAEIKKQLESNFNLLLEGHTSSVLTVAVTSDNKYIVSGSSDNSIRI